MSDLAQYLRDAAEQPHLNHRQLMLDSATEIDRLTAVVAAVHTALDQWEYRLGGYAGCRECVADVAKAVGR